MGLVDIPADLTGPGRLSIQLDLSRSEVTTTIQRLQDALEKLRSERRAESNPDTNATGSQLPPAASMEAPTKPHGTAAPPSPPAAISLAPPVSPIALIPKPLPIPAPPPSWVHKPAALPPAVQAPAVSQPHAAACSSIGLPSPSQPPAPSRHTTGIALKPVATPAPAFDERSAAPEGIPPRAANSQAAPSDRARQPEPAAREPQWQTCWRTDASDHSGDTVTAMVHVAALSVLPGGDGHAGWLISASRKLLNLWECSASGGRGEPSLQLMHQLATETLVCSMVPEVGTGLLLASAQDPGRPSGCVALHSLHAESGLFLPRGRLPLPPIGPNATAAEPFSALSQVVSLHPLGGPLTTCCAASSGGSLAVYPTTVAPGEIPKAKAVWRAHTAPVTTLHRSLHGMHLLSGAQDGRIHMWELKAKPSQPCSVFQHRKAVTGLNLINDRHLASSSLDGRLCLWDIRRPSQPLRDIPSPDSRGLVEMAVSPFCDSLGFASEGGGVYCVDLVDLACSVTTVRQPSGAVEGLVWNGSTGELYVASESSIMVLQQPL